MHLLLCSEQERVDRDEEAGPCHVCLWGGDDRERGHEARDTGNQNDGHSAESIWSAKCSQGQGGAYL